MRIAPTFIAALIVAHCLALNAIAAEDIAKPGAVKADAAIQTSSGEVKKIDTDAGKITIKHGTLVNLDMPPMTMVFKVKDPAILDHVKVGDKIKFVAENANGALTVTTLQVDK